MSIILETYSVYVACLASYNAGTLHGVWIDIEEGTTVDDVMEQVQAMLRESPEEWAEEWEIHDTDWFGGHSPRTIEEAVEYVERLAASGLDSAVFAAFVSLWDVDSADYAAVAYVGDFASDEEFAEHWADATGVLIGVPESLQYYFDYEKFGRDLMISDYSEHNGHYFSVHW